MFLLTFRLTHHSLSFENFRNYMKFHQISQAVLLLIQRWMSNEHMVFRDTLFKKKKPKITRCFFCGWQNLSTQSDCQWKMTEELLSRATLSKSCLTNTQRNICIFAVVNFKHILVDLSAENDTIVAI